MKHLGICLLNLTNQFDENKNKQEKVPGGDPVPGIPKTSWPSGLRRQTRNLVLETGRRFKSCRCRTFFNIKLFSLHCVFILSNKCSILHWSF